MISREERFAKAGLSNIGEETDYARAMGYRRVECESLIYGRGYVSYWLRSPAHFTDKEIPYTTGIVLGGDNLWMGDRIPYSLPVNTDSLGVRPAIRIEIEISQ